MRDIKVYYQPIDGDRVDLAIFSKHGRSELFQEDIVRVVEQEDLDDRLYSVVLSGMYEMFSKMEDELEIQRWMNCYVNETRMEWM